ncbi:MAG: hypothetical protein K2N87_10920 [Eubacterium sp.]|nr:hypothetical protein [Eubacterium sp.]
MENNQMETLKNKGMEEEKTVYQPHGNLEEERTVYRQYEDSSEDVTLYRPHRRMDEEKTVYQPHENVAQNRTDRNAAVSDCFQNKRICAADCKWKAWAVGAAVLLAGSAVLFLLWQVRL